MHLLNFHSFYYDFFLLLLHRGLWCWCDTFFSFFSPFSSWWTNIFSLVFLYPSRLYLLFRRLRGKIVGLNKRSGHIQQFAGSFLLLHQLGSFFNDSDPSRRSFLNVFIFVFFLSFFWNFIFTAFLTPCNFLVCVMSRQVSSCEPVALSNN